ncbi:MBL fold metallo-hydrolase [Leucobacter sp. NPDC077196]|uniref:MBL fold metallo-hydrolase n=1 Tax=Leucobacter sp. NPDC077196 TaxID=3154959 RepID=UPI003440ECA6
MSEARIERLVTQGTILVDRGGAEPEAFPIENNVWIVGDDEQVVVIDASHDAGAIVAAVGDRETLGILLTHGHNDHVNAAVELAGELDALIHLHPDDLFIWRDTHGDQLPDIELAHAASFMVAGVELTTLHTPGHTPGSVCFAVPALDTVFTGDTLFQGGPGATRWDYSSFPQIIDSIRTRLFPLPGETTALTGHGESTTIAAEHPALESWLERGW